jgi:hypothetical protein
VLDRIVTRMTDQGKHITWKLYTNLNAMLRSRRMRTLDFRYGGSDPSMNRS